MFYNEHCHPFMVISREINYLHHSIYQSTEAFPIFVKMTFYLQLFYAGTNPQLSSPSRDKMTVSTLCKYGQESVHDLIAKTSELFAQLKGFQVGYIPFQIWCA